ncbi:MAG: PAS domain S-box protein, partial [Clostridiaceae bacterium]
MKVRGDLSFETAIEAIFKEACANYKALIEASPDGIIVFTEEGRILLWNDAAEKIFGYTKEEVLGSNIKTIIFPENNAEVHNLELKNNGSRSKKSIFTDCVTKDGKLIPVHISLIPRGKKLRNENMIILSDISELTKTHEEIIQLERLKTVGQMAAGIGHEIRNPMTSVRGFLQLLKAKPQYSLEKEIFKLMISELDRANSIITEYLSFAKEKPSETELLNLNDLLGRIYPLVQADAFNQNKQSRLITTSITNLEINEKEITQLVLNVTKNGLEAMDKRGCITLHTYTEDKYVVLKIADDGCGILPEHLENIWVPFFTTKDSGTGLG